MCGLAGILGAPATDATLRAITRTLHHRGPDASGVDRHEDLALLHTRLIVRDPSAAGAQPMRSSDATKMLVYNGELYNDHELRGELEREGVRFRSSCDTETVLEALGRWGTDALGKFRGMFALAYVDLGARTCVLARDPFGIKPLHAASLPRGGLIFASEPGAILAHPEMTAEPDPIAVSAYLTTIRTTLGNRTMLRGIETLLPGEVRTYDLTGREVGARAWLPAVERCERSMTRGVIEDSVRAHLLSDVPLCALLSGGLDSSVIVSETSRGASSLNTFCSGAAEGGPDFAFAAQVAAHLGVHHTEVPVTEDRFGELWGELIGAQRVPLSTPNEVAIYEVARVLRASGHVVALSGEGADELFAGYETPMQMAWSHVRSGNDLPGRFQVRAHAWMEPEIKPGLLDPGFWSGVDEDSELFGWYDAQFELARDEPGADDPLEAHLRLHRRINLTGLLGRLDSATMRASVEGRTPFADRVVASHAASLSMDEKCVFDGAGRAMRTKLALRDAFAADLPASVVDRPKASFPMPFQSWLVRERECLLSSGYLRGVLTSAAIDAVAQSPEHLWSLGWPAANLARWGLAMGWDA